MTNQSWTIIIFCYNEEGSITKVIEDVYAFLERITPIKSEVLIVNDGSTDNTKQYLEKSASVYNSIRIINHPHNLGIGEALRSGYINSRYENVCAVPADGQFDMNEMIPYSSVPPKTFVSFHREVKTSYSSYRTLLSYMNRVINHYFLGLKMKDVNWVKIYKLEELRKINIQMHSSLIETEICSKLVINSNTMIEVPSTYNRRISGKVKGSSLKAVINISKELYKLIRIIQRFKHRSKKSGLKV
jgi:glycosyltransferase involved in cell wall biosynthesis